MSLWNNFIYRYCGRGKEVIKESDGNIVRERGIGKENRNEGVRILGRDDFSDLDQIKIIGPDGVCPGGERIGPLRELRN